jgi:hypothetical protein
MNLLGYFILAAVLLTLVILAVPVSLGYDSVDSRLRVKWLGLTFTKRLGGEKPAKIRPTRQKPHRERKRQLQGRAALTRLWQGRDLVGELINRVGKFGFEVLRTLSFRHTEVSLSLPDPGWNGLLYAVLGNLTLKDANLSVNFENRHYAKIWVTVYPCRLAQKLAGLLLRLPYLRLLKLAWDLKKCRQPL